MAARRAVTARIRSGTASPTVSVIMPTYNRRALVPLAVESVLAQTFDDFELLIVDDGSTDDTSTVLAERFGAEPRVHVIRTENGGIAAARNVAIERSKGRFVQFLDSDDRMLPNCLERQIACLEAHPEAQLVHCNSTFEGDGRDGERLFDDHTRLPRSIGDMFAGGWGSPDCMMLDGDVARDLLFDPTYRTAEDTDFLFRFFIAGHDAVISPEVLIVYRHHHGEDGQPQISRDDVGRAEARLRMMREHRRHAPDALVFEGVERYLCRRLAKAYVAEGRYRAARPHVRHWLKKRPLRPRLVGWLLMGFVKPDPQLSDPK